MFAGQNIPWTREEMHYILDNWDAIPKQRIAETVKRSTSTLYRMYRIVEQDKLGREESLRKYEKHLKKHGGTGYVTVEEQEKVKEAALRPLYGLNDKEVTKLKELWHNKTQVELSRMFNLSVGKIAYLGKKLNLPKKRVIVEKADSGVKILTADELAEKIAFENKQDLNILEIGKRYLFTVSDNRAGWLSMSRLGRVVEDYGRFYLIRFEKGYDETMLKASLLTGDVMYKKVGESFIGTDSSIWKKRAEGEVS